MDAAAATPTRSSKLLVSAARARRARAGRGRRHGGAPGRAATSCRAAFDEALETAAALALSAPGAEPPADLREPHPDRRPRDAAGGAGAAHAGRGGAGQPVVASAVTPAPAASGAASARSSRRRATSPPRSRSPPPCSASSTCRSAARRPATLEAQRDASALVSQALAAPGADVVALSGPGGRHGRGGAGVGPTTSRWSSPISCPRRRARCGRSGRFRPTASRSRRRSCRAAQNVLQLQESVPDGTTVAITPEPDDGTQHAAPTGQIALSGGVTLTGLRRRSPRRGCRGTSARRRWSVSRSGVQAFTFSPPGDSFGHCVFSVKQTPGRVASVTASAAARRRDRCAPHRVAVDEAARRGVVRVQPERRRPHLAAVPVELRERRVEEEPAGRREQHQREALGELVVDRLVRRLVGRQRVAARVGERLRDELDAPARRSGSRRRRTAPCRGPGRCARSPRRGSRSSVDPGGAEHLGREVEVATSAAPGGRSPGGRRCGGRSRSSAGTRRAAARPARSTTGRGGRRSRAGRRARAAWWPAGRCRRGRPCRSSAARARP